MTEVLVAVAFVVVVVSFALSGLKRFKYNSSI